MHRLLVFLATDRAFPLHQVLETVLKIASLAIDQVLARKDHHFSSRIHANTAENFIMSFTNILLLKLFLLGLSLFQDLNSSSLLEFLRFLPKQKLSGFLLKFDLPDKVVVDALLIHNLSVIVLHQGFISHVLLDVGQKLLQKVLIVKVLTLDASQEGDRGLRLFFQKVFSLVKFLSQSLDLNIVQLDLLVHLTHNFFALQKLCLLFVLFSQQFLYSILFNLKFLRHYLELILQLILVLLCILATYLSLRQQFFSLFKLRLESSHVLLIIVGLRLLMPQQPLSIVDDLFIGFNLLSRLV